MPYSHSQCRYLNEMGIVPWVKRVPSVKRSVAQTDAAAKLRDAVIDAQNSTVHYAAAPDTTNLTAETANTPGIIKTSSHTGIADSAGSSSAPSKRQFASEPVAQLPGLMQTPLVEIPFRGQRCTQLGKSDAPLLILIEASSTQQNQYPFESADAKIFDDMLRAISWRRQDACLAVLPPSSAPSLFADNDAPSVSDLCQPHRDAVLLFRQSVLDTHNIDELVIPLAREGMFAWQLPHPSLLRESPQRKRQAWNVLKAARARLS